MKRNPRLEKRARQTIKEIIRDRDITDIEAVMDVIRPHQIFDYNLARERELRELSRQVLSSIRDEAGVRDIFSFKDEDGEYRYVNVTTTQNIVALDSADKQLAEKYYGINKGRKKIELERLRALGQRTLDDTATND